MTTTTAAAPTTSVPTKNPHRLLTLLTGWAVIATVIGGLWGAGHDPEHAEWSAFAIVASILIYLFHKVRAVRFDRRNARNSH